MKFPTTEELALVPLSNLIKNNKPTGKSKGSAQIPMHAEDLVYIGNCFIVSPLCLCSVKMVVRIYLG